MDMIKSLRNLFKGHSDDTNKPQYRAYIDRYTDETLEGWAYLTKDPSKSIKIEVLVDDDVVGETYAWQYRHDLANAFQTDGGHGFSIKIDKQKLGKNNGMLTLRDSETNIIIETNAFSVCYDLTILYNELYFDTLREQYSDIEITKESPVEELAFNYYTNYQIEYCKETLEVAVSRQDDISLDFLIMLLRIYIAGEESTNSLTLYRYIEKIHKDEEGFNEVIEVFIGYLSSLWKDEVGFWPSPKDVHKLELLIVLFESIFKMDKVSLPPSIAITNKVQIDTFYAKSIKTGILFDATTLKNIMYILITDHSLLKINEKVWMKQYVRQLSFIEMLWCSTQIQSKENLIDIMEQVLLVHSDSAFSYNLRNETIGLFFNFIAVLINSKKLILSYEAKKVYDVVYKMKSTINSEDTLLNMRVDVLINDLMYLLDEKNEAYENLMNLIERNIDYVDWNSHYASDIIFDYETSLVKSSKSEYSNRLIYHRFKIEKANLTDLLLILIDMVRHQESHGMDSEKSIQLFSLLFAGVCNTKLLSEKKVKLIKMYSEQFFHGLLRQYMNYALKLRQNKLQFDDIEIFQSDILEEMNLISVGNINKMDFTQKILDKVDKNFSHLVRNSMEVDRVENRYGQNAVLIFIDKINEEVVLDYYRGMLKNSTGNNSVYYLLLEKYFYKLTSENDTVFEKYNYKSSNIIKELVSTSYKGYLVIDDSFIVHHKSEESFEEKGNYIFYTSDGKSFSYFLQRREWVPFVELLGPIKINKISDLRTILFTKMKDAFNSSLIKFTKYDTGIISAKAVPKNKVSHLCNFNIPVWEDIETKETLRYLTHLYANEKIKNIASINTNDAALNLIKPFEIEEQKDDIACFLVQRNEFLRIEGFLEYYRTLGVNKFYIIDNASNDGKTLEYLLEQTDVELYSTIQAYSQSKYGVMWAEVLIKTKRQGKWSLLLDADELLFFDSAHKSIQDMCAYLDSADCDSLYSPFLDMYSDTSISKTRYLKGEEILQTCQFYDRHFFTTFTGNGGVMGNLPTYQGGVRSRAFGLDTVVLNKLPIFKYNPYMKLREGLHWIDNCRPMYGKSVLLHFKYIETFHEYVESEVTRGQHWNGASEYKQYLDFMHKNANYTMYDSVLSAKFTSVNDFYKSQFKPLKISQDSCEQEN